MICLTLNVGFPASEAQFYGSDYEHDWFSKDR